MAIDFDKVINRKGTHSLKYDFATVRGKKADILPFWVADMDFQAPKAVRERLFEIVEHGIFGYSDTLEDYFRAVKSWYKRRFDWEIESDWIIKTPGIVFALAMSILNLLKIRKVSGFKIDFVSTFGKPFAAAAVMGIVTFGVFRLFDTLIGGRVIPVCISLIVAILVYAVVMLKIGTLSEDDILDLPMGGRILRISKKFHLLPAVKVEE